MGQEIGSIQTVVEKPMETVWILLITVVVLALVGVHLWCVAWVIGDSQERGAGGGGTLFLIWMFGPLAALIWLLTRPSTTVAERPANSYDNADDALAAAARLDKLGDWEAALEIYQDAAQRWPEHGDYIESCVTAIREKQTLH